MKNISIIFGRKNSKGLKNKNIRKLLTKPMFVHVIDEAKKVKQISKIYVSSDSSHILKESKKKGCEIINRPKYLCSDKALLSDAIFHATDYCMKKEKEIDNFIVLLCNSICFDSKSIDRALNIIKKNNILDTVTTISKFNMFSPVRAMKIKGKKIENYIPNSILKKYTNLSGDRDKSTDAYFCNHSFTISRAKVFKKPKSNPMPFKWMGKNKFFIKQPFCVGDVDFEWQIPVVKWWIKKFKN